MDVLERELAAAHRAGLAEFEMVVRAPLAAFDTGSCLRFPNQGQFHPFSYLNGLAEAILRMGGEIFCNTRVTNVRVGGAPLVETESGHGVSWGPFTFPGD